MAIKVEKITNNGRTEYKLKGKSLTETDIMKMRKSGKQVTFVEPEAVPKVSPVRRGVLDSVKPLQDQKGDRYFLGQTESQWDRNVQGAHRTIQQDFQGDYVGARKYLVDRFGESFEPEADGFIKWANKGNRINKQSQFGVPHAYASENQWVSRFNLSGNETAFGSDLFDDPEVTDLFNTKKMRGVDVQDIMWTPGSEARLTVPVQKSMFGKSMQYALDDARHGHGWTLNNVIERAKEISERTIGDAGYSDKLSQSRRGTPKKYEKKLLVGNVISRDQPGVGRIVHPRHGTFNPTPGVGEYAIDLEGLDKGLMNTKLSDFEGPDYRGQFVGQAEGKAKLTLPLDKAKQISGSNKLVERIITSEVLSEVDKDAISKGLRVPGQGRTFHGTFLPTDTGPKLNLKSAKRMAGEKIVKGGLLADVAVTGALSYATGESDNIGEAAWAGATSLIPDAGGTANIKDIGGKLYSHDESTNMVTPLSGGKTKGLAYKDGKPVAVDYGSLKGRTSMIDDIVTPVKAIGQSIVDTHQRRQSERKPISTVGKSRYSQGAKARPSNGQGWWNQALGALGLQ